MIPDAHSQPLHDVVVLPPTLRQKVGSTVIPGDKLGIVGVITTGGAGGIGGGPPSSSTSRSSLQLVSGSGTYVRRGHIRASVVGTVCASLVRRCDDDDGDGGGGRGGSSPSCRRNRAPPPTTTIDVDDREWDRSYSGSYASVDMIAIVIDDGTSMGGGGGQEIGNMIVLPYREPYSGTLRLGELRSGGGGGGSSVELRIEECVRPGDLLLARVHAMGEREYVLSTAEAELGVVRAICESSGMTMEAVSWKEMRCPVTLAREGRKVAKPRLV
ncbi:hypothetical protein ACHAXA_003846 [Cyclostephanos tholiformis]|uniref:Exosome complex component N-terminal domain-containing protein n=1 Tax=Cyclostephanos tholiformis TaxID=382380 RepID=A0ABD3R6J9_9STRA